MWFVTAALAADPTLATTPAAEPPLPEPAELSALARKHTRRGVAEVGLGLALTGGGVFVLSYDRGESGAMSDEEPWVMDARSLGGGMLMIGGFTSLVVGGNDVSVGRRLRLQAATLTPAYVPGGAGAVVSARF